MIKIYSWNVNGIRAVHKKGLWTKFIDEHKPDILLLQEIKAKPDQIDIPLYGYDAFWYPAEKAGYSGTAIISKLAPLQVINGFPKDVIEHHNLTGDIYGDPNLEGRVMAVEYEKFWLISVYTPNAKEDLSRIPLKYKQWDPAFLEYVTKLNEQKPVIFGGDINVAHTEDDLANPKANKGKKGFTREEISGFQAFIDQGFIDSFRMYHQGNGHYTWWSHFANARARNVGWRIDYLMVASSIKTKVKSADIHPEVLGSDHCPISVTLDL
ncbi:MAG TPA: exodeoxyribonuclease III [Candidatus Saccharimonadales bacterium]|nr:exodeoxyribonuclease III [Candidatus Saccharimonadales bacterium]